MSHPKFLRRIAPSLRRIAPGLVAVALFGAACSSGEEGVEASGAWARTSAATADTGAAYLVLSSTEAVTIVSASVPAEVAGRVELHETTPVDAIEDGDAMEGGEMDEDAMEEGDATGNGEMEDMDHGDMDMGDTAMTMQPIDAIEIPAGGEVAFEPGGLHVMLLDLVDPLEAGETFDVTFTEDDGDQFTVAVEVMDEAP